LIPRIRECGNFFPRFQGELELPGLDQERCELRVRGGYRPAPSANGDLSADAQRRRAARATIRAFLRRIASGLEDEHKHGHAATYRPPPLPGTRQHRE
jgi:hypothetical protein